MHLNQIYPGDCSHAAMRGLFPATPNDTRIVHFAEFHEPDENFDIREAFNIGMPEHVQLDPFFQNQASPNIRTRSQVTVEPPRPAKFPTLRGGFAADALRRDRIQRELRRDSGVIMAVPNGCQNANVSAIPPLPIPMDLANRIEAQGPGDILPAAPQPMEARERKNTILSVRKDHQKVESWTPSRFQSTERQKKTLSINTDRSRSNSPTTGLKGNHILNNFTATSNLKQGKRQPSRGHEADPTALMFQEIEGKGGEAQKKILEEHLDKIFKIIPPPLSESPARSVEVVNEAKDKDEEAQRARFANAEAEMEIQEMLKKQKGVWASTVGRVRAVLGKGRARQYI